jgi:tight adherence protein B
MSTSIALLACLALLAAFTRRARLGARARAAAGVHLRVTGLLARLSPARAVIGALGAFVAMGQFGLVTGAIGGMAWEPLMRARKARAGSRRLDEQLPEVLRSIGAAVRAGRSLPQALEVARDEAGGSARAALDAAIGAQSAGASFDAALDAFALSAGTPAAREVAATLRIGRAAGSNLPAVLDVAVESMVEAERIARDRRAATSQARLSAVVIGAMPVAFFAMVGSSARAQLRVLTGDPLGWAILGLGLLLEAGGTLWIRSVTKART